VRKINSAGVISTVAGTGSGGYNGDNIQANTATLWYPNGVALDAAGNLYISDGVNNRIRKVDASGIITTVAGTGTPGFTGNGGAATSAQLDYPFGITVTGAGEIYFADLGNSRVRKIDVNGIITHIGGNGNSSYSGDNGAATSAGMYPVGMEVDANGDVLIADEGNYRVRKIDMTSGIITTIAGTGNGGYNGDNIAATSANLYSPNGLFIDTNGDLFVSDACNARVRKIAAPCVNPTIPMLNAGVNAVCEGGSTTLSIATGTLNSATDWEWYSGSCGGTTEGSGTSITVSPTVTTTYYVRGEGGCITPGSCAQITITVNDSVEISTQPAASLAVCDGGTLNLSVAANNAAGYQWYDANGMLSDGGDVSGATSASLQINNATSAQAGNYYVEISGSSPCASLNSSASTVSIDYPAAISTQPQPLTVCSGAAGEIAVAATGAGLSYQWYDAAGALSDNSIFTGTSDDTLRISNSMNLDGTTYYVIATGTCGSPATSSTVTLSEDQNNTWTGAISQAWSDAGNWSCGILPLTTTNVTIPATAINMPLVDSFNLCFCNNLTVQAGASLTFADTFGRLFLNGDFINNGSFDGSGGIISLGGQAPQTIAGGTYGSIELGSASTITIDSDLTVTGFLALNNGFLQLNNHNLFIEAQLSLLGMMASPYSFIVTNDSGSVVVRNVGLGGHTGAVTIPVGISASSYTPVVLENVGTADTFTVRVMPNVYLDGYGVSPGQVSSPVVDRTWLVSEHTPGGSYVNMTPHWNLANEMNGFNQVHVYVAHYTGGMWISYQDSSLGAPSAGFSNGLYTAYQDSIQTFSPFTVASSGLFPLAMTMEDITAVNLGRANRVQWSNNSEESGDMYELERSSDGRSFSRIASVKAENKEAKYNYRDEQALSGVNYYRVKLTSSNGKQQYSKVVSAKVVETGAVSMDAYPNPVEGVVNVRVNGAISGAASLVVTDVAGRVVSNAEMKSSSAQINMSGFAPGVYFIKYSDEVRVETVKVNKR
jgi:hypothetical protein